jgi:hypothetical protein
LYKNDAVVLVDASNGKDAKVTYEAKHLDQALFVDLNTDLGYQKGSRRWMKWRTKKRTDTDNFLSR